MFTRHITNNTRCIDGRLWRHTPMADDPCLETDAGACSGCFSCRPWTTPVTVEIDDIAQASDRYIAYQGDMDLDIPIGRGATPEEAVRDLAWAIDVEDDDQIAAMIAGAECPL